MGLSRKKHKIQATIANTLKKGLLLAGLLSSLMVTTSCDLFKKSSDNGPAAGYIPEPNTAEVVTQKQSEEPAIQPPADKHPDTPVGQESNVSEAKPNKTAWITTGAPKLPIVSNVNSEVLNQKDFNDLIEKNIRSTKDANDVIENSLRPSKINPK